MPIVRIGEYDIDFPDDMSQQEIRYRVENDIMPRINRAQAQETLAPGALYGDLPITPEREQPAQDTTLSDRLGQFRVARQLLTGDPVGAAASVFMQIPRGQQEAAVRGAAQGATLGFADELTGAAQAVPGIFTDTEESLGDRYRRARDESRAAYKASQEAYPGTYLAGELVGGFATGGAGGARTIAGQTLRRALPRLAATGAGVGGVAGAGYSEADVTEGDLGGLGRDVAGGAVTGAIAAPAVALAGEGARRVVTGGWRAIRGGAEQLSPEATISAKNSALAQLRRTMKQDNVDPEQLEAIFEANPALTLADLGENLTRRLGNISRRPGAAAQRIAQQMENRNIDQLDRVAPTFSQALGGTEIVPALKRSVQRTKELAGPLYDAAYASELRGTKTLQDLMSRDAAQKALKKARELASNEGVDITGRENNVRLIDYVQRALRDKEGKELREGALNAARVTGGLRKNILREVDRQVPEFGQARAIAADEFANRDALDLGKSIFKKETANLREAIQDMSRSEREHLRIGVFDAVMNRLRSKVETANLARDFKIPKIRDAIELAFDDPAQFAEFRRVMGNEERMFETMRKTVQNSLTAERTVTDRALDAENINLAADVLGGNVFSAARQGVGRAAQFIQGRRGEARDDILTDLLLGRPTAADLAPLPSARPAPLLPSATVPTIEQTLPIVQEDFLSGLVPSG